MTYFNRFILTPAARGALDAAFVFPVVLLAVAFFMPSAAPALGLQ